MNPLLPGRVDALQARFVAIERERMAGIPILHPGLQVHATGFTEWQPAPLQAGDPLQDTTVALGVLITPWFMSLLLLPLETLWHPDAVGHRLLRAPGPQSLEFLGAQDDVLGYYESCALFSPMQDFADQPHAIAVAHAVLEQLRQPAAPGMPQEASAVPRSAAPTRRALLFGRRTG